MTDTQTTNALRVAQIMRQAHEAKVEIMLHNSTYDRTNPYHTTFESRRDGMEIKGRGQSHDPLLAIIDAWDKFERLALTGDKRLLVAQIEAKAEE